MSARTGIEWTDHTFNVAWGCEKVSPGCANCYADGLARRYGHQVWGPAKSTPRRTFGEKHWDEPLRWNAAAERDGVRRRVFCSSMADVFEEHPTIEAERAKLWALIRTTPALDWQLLTKRPERIAANLPDDWGAGFPNVWLGTSVENQRFAFRAALLCQVPARVRFISAEPLLGPVNLTCVRVPVDDSGYSYRPLDDRGIAWVIVGGESGPKARPMREEWARALRDQCADHGVAFFLKQLGGWPDKRGHDAALLDGVRHLAMPAAPAEVAS